jgi:hypothetical protein
MSLRKEDPPVSGTKMPEQVVRWAASLSRYVPFGLQAEHTEFDGATERRVATEKLLRGANQGGHQISPRHVVQNGCSTLSTGKLAISVLEISAATSILTVPGAICRLPLAQTEPATAITAITAIESA